MNIAQFAGPVAGLMFAPFLLGIINRTKAKFAGRKGQPLMQVYRDIWKLFHKGAVYSRTTTWVFRAGPIVTLAAVLLALFIVPFGSLGAPVGFAGDFILLGYLLAVGRFFTVSAALDTGSAFEGMGASREVKFSALAEPVFVLGLIAMGKAAGTFSLSTMCAAGSPLVWTVNAPAIALVGGALFAVVLVENARIPFDDPNTHLELTMIHEVMVLDHSGPDFAYVTYGAALKLWVLGAVLVSLVAPRTGNVFADGGIFLAGMFALCVLIGIVESTMARLRLLRVPNVLIGASALAVIALFLTLG